MSSSATSGAPDHTNVIPGVVTEFRRLSSSDPEHYSLICSNLVKFVAHRVSLYRDGDARIVEQFLLLVAEGKDFESTISDIRECLGDWRVRIDNMGRRCYENEAVALSKSCRIFNRLDLFFSSLWMIEPECGVASHRCDYEDLVSTMGDNGPWPQTTHGEYNKVHYTTLLAPHMPKGLKGDELMVAFKAAAPGGYLLVYDCENDTHYKRIWSGLVKLWLTCVETGNPLSENIPLEMSRQDWERSALIAGWKKFTVPLYDSEIDHFYYQMFTKPKQDVEF